MTSAPASRADSNGESLAVFERRYFQHYLDEARSMAAAGEPVALLAETTPGGLAGSVRWRELLGPMGLGDELRVDFTAGAALPRPLPGQDCGARPIWPGRPGTASHTRR